MEFASKEESLLIPAADENDHDAQQQGRRDPQHSPSPTETTYNTLSTCSSSPPPHHLDNNINKGIVVENMEHNQDDVEKNNNTANTKSENLMMIPDNEMLKMFCVTEGISNEYLTTKTTAMATVRTIDTSTSNIEERKKNTGNQSSTRTTSTASTSTTTLASSSPIKYSDQELQHKNHQSTFSNFVTHAKGYWNNLEEEAEFTTTHRRHHQGGGRLMLDGSKMNSSSSLIDNGGGIVAAAADASDDDFPQREENATARNASSQGQQLHLNQANIVPPTPVELLKSRDGPISNTNPSQQTSQPSVATLHPSSTPRRVLSARVSSNDPNKSNMIRFELAQQEAEQKIRQQQKIQKTETKQTRGAYPSQQAKESFFSARNDDAANNATRIRRDQFILQQETMAKSGSGHVNTAAVAAGDVASVTNNGDAAVVLKEEVEERSALVAAENLQDASYPSQQAKTINQLTSMESQGSDDDGAFHWNRKENAKEGYGQDNGELPGVNASAHTNLDLPGTSPTEGNQDVTDQHAIEKQDDNKKMRPATTSAGHSSDNKAQPGQVQPGAYSQAPGKNCRRNRSIRNSVISQHSMSAQMSRSGDIFGASCPDLGFRMSTNGNNIGNNASFSTMSASYNSRDGPRFSPRRHRSKKKKRKRSSYQSKQSEQSIDEEIVSEDEHEQKMASMLSNLLEFSSDEEDERVNTGRSSSRPPAMGQGRQNTKPGSQQQSGQSINNSLNTSVSSAQAPSPPSSPPIKRIRHTKRCISGRSQVSEISNMTEEDTSLSLDFMIGSPPSSAVDLWLGSDAEEEKEEIASAGNNSGGDLSTVGSLSDIPHRTTKRIVVPSNGSDNPTRQGGSAVGTSGEQIRRQQQPATAGRVSSTARAPNYGFTNTRRFFNLSSYGGGSAHSRQRRKLSLLSENSSTLGDFSSGSGSMLSLTELRSRASSTGGSSSVTTTTTMAARQPAGRIARNLSLYMRGVGLPVAATVVEEGDDDALESELRRRLELEIRKELELEMEEFRRQMVLQVVGAAEPVTANVISINSSRQRLVLPPREEESLGMEMSVEMASLQAGLRERERRDAAAVRSSMNRELGRMYIDMKRSQRAHGNDQDRLFGPIPGIDNSYEEVFHDEEMQMEGSTKITRHDEPNGGTTWDRVWLGMVVAFFSGLLLGVGIMAAAQ